MIEGWGSGIPNMFADAEDYGLPEPSLEDRGSDFRVNLYRNPLKTDLYGVLNPEKNGANGANKIETGPISDTIPQKDSPDFDPIDTITQMRGPIPGTNGTVPELLACCSL